ncbi:hypothetical protein I4F81_006993 [Pyropia yezoensis]|uniref:Uncharacterized protein n=1 Tax=Pyropia yezoensis TaxID=2788 RepID=A0ACC3C3S6_PYRYE|nr:hypothetical protein I4F81_006993 [Neopyropia yezoensis]
MGAVRGWAVGGATSPLAREACTFGAADEELVFRTAGGPAFSVLNDSQVMCVGVSAVQSADVANCGGHGPRVAFGDGRLAAPAVANGTGFVVAGAAARAAMLAGAVRLDVYTPKRLSASKMGAVAAALAAAASDATGVATVDVGASAAAAAAGAAVQTVHMRVAPAAAAAARSAMVDALASGAVARAARLAPGGLHLEALSLAPGSGRVGGGGE